MAGLDRFGRFVNRRELKALSARLEEGEHVLAAVEARGDERDGVLAVSDRRVLFVSVGWLRTRAASWAHRDLLGLEVTPAVDDAQVLLRTRATPVSLRARKADAAQLKAAYDGRPRAAGEAVDFAVPAAEAERRKRLARLDRMLERGSITRAEYERSKRALADGLPDEA